MLLVVAVVGTTGTEGAVVVVEVEVEVVDVAGTTGAEGVVVIVVDGVEVVEVV